MAYRLSTWFFGRFFQFLLALVCASQWVTVWWLLAGGHSIPLWVHPAGIAALWLFNLRLVRGAGRMGRHAPSPRLALRLYFATAFASLFCFVFLVAASVLRVALAGIQSALFAHTDIAAAIAFPSAQSFMTFTQVGFAGIGLTFLYGYTIGQRRLCVREMALPAKGLAAALHGIRIAHITDIHMGQNMEPAELAAFVERVNRLRADLICVTGDMIDSARTDIDLFLPIFAELRARYGVYAVLGNHDHSAGAERVVAGLRRHTRIHLLRDEHVPVPIGDAELHLIGLDDRGPDWARGHRRDPRLETLFARVPKGAPVLLLNHRPDLFEHAADLGILATLAGHTHGGQIAVPWFAGKYLNPSQLITPFDRGLYRRGDCHLYTNCGLGVTAQRVRICTPREIAVFELQRA